MQPQVKESKWEHADTSALSELVGATRELMKAAALTDISATRIRACTQAIAKVTADLEQQSRLRCVRQPLPEGAFIGQVIGTADPVVGTLNPMALPLQVFVGSDGVARASINLGAIFEGPVEGVHGGYSAMLMDALMGSLVRALGVGCMTGTLTLRYVDLTPLDTQLDLQAQVVERAGRKVFVTAAISAGGSDTVQAQGTFIMPRST